MEWLGKHFKQIHKLCIVSVTFSYLRDRTETRLKNYVLFVLKMY